MSVAKRFVFAQSLCIVMTGITCLPSCNEATVAEAPGSESTEAKKAVVKSAEASDNANTALPFVYSSIGKRDPFRSFLADLVEIDQDHGMSRRKEETEQYELDQYRLTGLITGTSQPKAMVEDPSGRGHVLHIGSRLGRNGGRLTHIAPTGMVIVEETRDPTGKKMRLPITVRLPKSEFDDVVQK